MDPSKPESDGYYHPETEADVSHLITRARQEQLKVRVRGSAHSISPAIYADNYDSPPPDAPDINIYLDRMRGVVFDDENMQVTVQGGCNLGRDPVDPTSTSTEENSLVYQLEKRRWALPVTGGIIHQTVGGFLSTGSAGGSLKYSLSNQLLALTFIDGVGNRHELVRSDDPDDKFYGAGVSMGLLGVLTSATFQCVPSFNVTGQEWTGHYRKAAVDLFGDGEGGRPSLQRFFEEAEYARCMWWPQKGVRKIVVWQAQRVSGTPPSPFPRPYHELPKILGSTKPAEFVAGITLRILVGLNPPGPATWLEKLVSVLLLRPFHFVVINSFIASSFLGPRRFWDVWHKALPMDDNVNYEWLPTEFMEMWIPISKTKEVMRKLRSYYEASDITKTGTYCLEIYPTPSNEFWMSPAYGRDVVKFDVFWFEKNKGNPLIDFYPQFWELMKEFNYRLHWGKYLLRDPAYLRAQYPRWDDFMALREEMDPDQVLVSDYWREHLGILSEQ